MESCTPIDGQNNLAVGCTFQCNFRDGARWVIQTTEISNVRKSIVFDVVSCEPSHVVSGVTHTLALKRVTSVNATFFEWSTDFTNDVTANVIADNSLKKIDALAEFNV